jgi:hypothetical protein
MVVVQVKCWDVLPLTLRSFANNRLPEDENTCSQKCFFNVVIFVCFLVQNIAVKFEYQRDVHFRSGHIVKGCVVSFWGGAKFHGLPKQSEGISVCLYFMNNNVKLWKF